MTELSSKCHLDRMLTSFSRYTFQPHHFVLAHDIVLDNVEQNTEQYDDNFDCNKENDTQLTWDFPINSSNLFHASNTSLESLNLKNAVKSKLGSRKIPLQEQIKRHKAETMETMCSLRIEDFAKIGTDCVRLNLDSIINRKNLAKNISRQIACKNQEKPDELNQATEHLASFKKIPENHFGTTHDGSRRISRKLPDIPKSQMRESAFRLAQDPVPASSLIRTPSLAEELKAALLAENPSYADTTHEDDDIQNSLPIGFHLNLSLDSEEESNFTPDFSELGSPEQIDPVNKYGNFSWEFVSSKKKVCRKSCCLSENYPDVEQPKKSQKDAGMSSAAVVVKQFSTGSSNTESGFDSADLDNLNQQHFSESCRELNRMHDTDFPGLDDDSREGKMSFVGDCQGDDQLLQTAVVRDETAANKNEHSLVSNKSLSPAVGKKPLPPCDPGAGASFDFEMDELDATHRGCHKFIPRHPGELAIDIGDYIYVQVEDDDLWCEGINLRTKLRGIFPTAYVTDLSLFDDEGRGSRFFVKYLGSIEVGFHKGNDVLCQAINKLAAARRQTAETNPPPLCCLEITEHGVKMTDRSKKKPKLTSVSSHLRAKLSALHDKSSSDSDHLFLLKNISFCGYHPKNEKYMGFITKHPLDMRFACHVFQSERSTKIIAESIGDAFRKFYQEYLAFVYPTEDIYME